MHKLTLLTLMTIFLFLFLSEAKARPALDAATQTEINQLYDMLITNPMDRSLNIRYSTALAKAGDYEAAIPPLERILINEPQNAWLMLQLGILYHALDAKLLARMYLEQAVAQPDITDDIKQKASTLLATL